MAETGYRIPVYRGWPERPYQVLGSIRFEDSNKYWDDGIFAMAAGAAKRQGGDAIIIRQGTEFGVGKLTGFADPGSLFSYNQTTALVIRWLTPEEIRAAELKNEEFLRRFNSRYPDLQPNMDVRTVCIRLLLQVANGDYSDRMLAQFADIMQRVSIHNSGLSGEWLLKGNLSMSTVTSAASDEQPFLGVATVRVDGENIAIVSSMGTPEVSFNGLVNKGRLSGTIGIGSFTAKCEGAALEDKMSFSFQSLTPGGTVRGNIVFQRSVSKQNPNPNESIKTSSLSRRWSSRRFPST